MLINNSFLTRLLQSHLIDHLEIRKNAFSASCVSADAVWGCGVRVMPLQGGGRRGWECKERVQVGMFPSWKLDLLSVYAQLKYGNTSVDVCACIVESMASVGRGNGLNS